MEREDSEGATLASWTRNCVGSVGLQQVVAEPRKVSGSLQVLLKLVEETWQRRMRMVWIDPCDCLDPVTAFDRSPQHLLWARGGGLGGALRVADAVLRDENFPFVCLDGVLLEENEWKRIPLNRWYRLQRLANRRGSALILWTPPVVIPAATRRWSLAARWSFSDCFTASREELRAGVSLMATEERAGEWTEAQQTG